MIIPIFMTTDDRYIDQAYVALYSVCDNTSIDNNLEVTILCDVTLRDDSREKMMELSSFFSNVSISFYEVDPLLFLFASSDYYVPIATFYRLICADVIDGDKAIFLDSDLVVTLDIAELYQMDIEDNYLAGVKDIFPIQFPNFGRDYARDYNFKDFSDYINCGVLLMNLNKIRKDGLVQRFIDGILEKNKFVDQDILNRVCHGHIKLLPWRFNYTPRNTEEEFDILLGFERGEEKGEIIHYCGPNKPWGSDFCYKGEIWWQIAKKALEEAEYNRLMRAKEVCYGKLQVLELAQKCEKKGGPVIIAGYSDHGQFVRYTLKKYGIKDLIIFGDNDPCKRNLKLGADQVYSIEELAEKYPDAVWINAVQVFRNEINEQLDGLGISKDNIFHYYCAEDNGDSSERRYHNYAKWLIKKRQNDKLVDITAKENGIIIDAFDGVGWGGMEMWSYRVAEGLKQRGKDVVIYGNDKQVAQGKWEEIIQRFPFESIKPNDSREVIENFYEDMEKRLPFVLINNWSQQALVAAIALKAKYPDAIKIVTIVHNEVDFLYRRINEFQDYMDIICCVSSNIRESLIKKCHLPAEKVIFHNNFVMGNIFEKGIERSIEKPLKIAVACRLDVEQKRADLIPELIEKLDKTNVEYQFDIAGEGDYNESLETWLKENSKEDHVRLLGYLDKEAMDDFWNQHHVYVSLSEYEGQSLAMLEAMARGVVPVVTRVSGTEDVITNRYEGFLTTPTSVDEIVDAIVYLYEHEDIRRVCSINCCNRIKEDCSFEKYISFIESII